MSGTLYIKFAKGEIVKVKKIFKKLSPDGINLFPPDFKEIPENSKKRGLYVEFKNKVMSLDHAIWDQWSSAWSLALAQELDKFFKIEEVSWCSVGSYKSMDEFRKAGLLILNSNKNPNTAVNKIFKIMFGFTIKKLLKIEDRMRKEALDLIQVAQFKVKDDK